MQWILEAKSMDRLQARTPVSRYTLTRNITDPSITLWGGPSRQRV